MAAMQRAGLRVVTAAEAKPAVLFGGRRVSFRPMVGVPMVGVGLIEILESGDG
jgi:hypothetical protein